MVGNLALKPPPTPDMVYGILELLKGVAQGGEQNGRGRAWEEWPRHEGSTGPTTVLLV